MNYFLKKKVYILLTGFVFSTAFSDSIFFQTYKNHLSDAWYPVKSRSLIRKLAELADIAQKQYSFVCKPSSVKALICPHAGYNYSGAVASSAYQLLQPGIFKRVIILAPYHQNEFSGVGLPGAEFDFYKNPLGWVPLDVAMIKKLKKSSPLFMHRQQAHEHEHAIEVQIPFIQTYCGDCKIVPILIGVVSDDDIKTIAQCLKPFLDEQTLLVVSSDFTHYGKQFDYEPFQDSVTQNIFKLDTTLIEKIQQFDLSGFSQLLQKTQATVCGASPIKVLLSLLQQKAFGQDIASYVVGYSTSAVDKKNPAHSVSYASIVFSKQLPKDLSIEDRLTGYEKKLLLKLARQELERVVTEHEKIKTGLPAPIQNSLEIPGILTQSLKKSYGAFVTLYEQPSVLHDKKLRGCIGTLTSSLPLYQLVVTMAESAALSDSRFSSVQTAELPYLFVSISVVTQPRPIHSYLDIVLGADGIILRHGNFQAVYLPQVAIEQRWNLQQTLSSLSEKAGLDKNIWQDPKTTCEVFQAIEFSEK